MTTNYHLSPQVFACVSGRHCMFLDLKRDSYFSLPTEAIDSLIPWIRNWSLAPNGPPPVMPPSGAPAALAAELLAAGILTEEIPKSPELRRIAPAVYHELASAPHESTHESPTLPILSVTAALARASWELRTTSILRIVRAMQKDKCSRTASEQTDSAEAARLTRIFLRFRPLFPRNYCCLFDSLALLRYLSGFQLFPDWVFGVQVDPFNAHCWVQAGNLLLNDQLDHVSRFTPIMTV